MCSTLVHTLSGKGRSPNASPRSRKPESRSRKRTLAEGVTPHHRNSKDGISEYVNCSNKLCYNGGVSVCDVLRHMVDAKLTEYESEVRICQGYEGSPKGRRRRNPCVHTFKVEARVKYKGVSAAGDDPSTSSPPA